jgi:uncharacterized protein (TIGR00290 family)
MSAKEPVVLSWSGGKDSAMTLYELLRSDDCEVVSLLTTVSEEYRRISHHGVRESLLDQQAEAIGIPLRKVYLPSGPDGGCTNDVYEMLMKEAMLSYQRDGIRTVAFGDLFLQDLREWREANLAKVGMRAIFPIWNRNTTELAYEVIALGFKCYLSCVQASLGAHFVGRLYSGELLRELPGGIDPCGENGEFHSFVCEGPIFTKTIPLVVGENVERAGNFLPTYNWEPKAPPPDQAFLDATGACLAARRAGLIR